MKDSIVFKLIKSLSPKEKAYFKRFAKIYKTDVSFKYLNAFDLINKMENYQEERLLKEFKIDKKRLSTINSELYNRILKAMRNCHASQQIAVRLKELWIDANFLYGKGLRTESLKLIRTAKKLAKNACFELEYFDFLILEGKVHRDKARKETLKWEIENNKKIKNSLRQIELETKMYMLYREVNQKVRDEKGNAIVSKQLLQQLNNLIESIPICFPNQLTIIYFLFILSKCQGGLNNMKSSKSYEKNIVDIFEGNEKLKEGHLLSYITVLNIYINSSFGDNKMSAVIEMIQALNSIKPKQLNHEIALFSVRHHFEILLNFKQKDYTSITKLAKEIEIGLKKYKEKIRLDRRITFYYNIGVAYFLDKNYKETSQWLKNFLIMNDFKAAMPSTQLNAQFIWAITEFEEFIYTPNLKELEHLERILRTSIKIIKKNLEENSALQSNKQLINNHPILKTLATLINIVNGRSQKEKNHFFYNLYDDIKNEPIIQPYLPWLASKIL